jgi:hypothetical protein
LKLGFKFCCKVAAAPGLGVVGFKGFKNLDKPAGRVAVAGQDLGMSAQRRATTPPDGQAEVVTNSLRPDSRTTIIQFKDSADPFGGALPGSGRSKSQLFSHKESRLTTFF